MDNYIQDPFFAMLFPFYGKLYVFYFIEIIFWQTIHGSITRLNHMAQSRQ